MDRLDAEGRAIRRAWGVPDAALLVVYVGMLNADRLFAPLIEAAAGMENVWLVIGGTGTEQGKLQAAAAHNPRMRLIGWVPPDDVFAIVSAGDVVYYGLDAHNPNSPYVMSNLTLLALAAGRPLLLTPTGEIAEVVCRSGCGVVLDQPTAESARLALQRLANPTYRVTLGHQARFICQEEYHWCKSADQLLTVYRGI
jgi:glycosyltransferase involved in cell wall biosynthesis